MSKSVLAEGMGWCSCHPGSTWRLLQSWPEQRSALTLWPGCWEDHASLRACFAIANCISHFITWKNPACCSPKLPTLQELCRWGIKVKWLICVLLIKPAKFGEASLAPSQVKLSAACHMCPKSQYLESQLNPLVPSCVRNLPPRKPAACIHSHSALYPLLLQIPHGPFKRN